MQPGRGQPWAGGVGRKSFLGLKVSGCRDTEGRSGDTPETVSWRPLKMTGPQAFVYAGVSPNADCMRNEIENF